MRFQQVDDLCLDGDVQRRDRLIADDELRVHSQGAGDADPLPLAAGKLVGVPAHVVGLEAHRLQQGGHLFVPLSWGILHMLWMSMGSRNDLAHRHTGIQRGIGVLEDHLHIPPEVLHFACRVSLVMSLPL